MEVCRPNIGCWGLGIVQQSLEQEEKESRGLQVRWRMVAKIQTNSPQIFRIYSSKKFLTTNGWIRPKKRKSPRKTWICLVGDDVLRILPWQITLNPTFGIVICLFFPSALIANLRKKQLQDKLHVGIICSSCCRDVGEFFWVPGFPKLKIHGWGRFPEPSFIFSGPFGFEICLDWNLRCWTKNRGKVPPKWMVKIMENPLKMDDLGGKPTISGNSQRFSSII